MFEDVGEREALYVPLLHDSTQKFLVFIMHIVSSLAFTCSSQNVVYYLLIEGGWSLILACMYLFLVFDYTKLDILFFGSKLIGGEKKA